jgi:hypothetical protein
MIIKCRLCKREFATNRQRKDHERDSHPKDAVKYLLSAAAKRVGAAQSTETAANAGKTSEAGDA